MKKIIIIILCIVLLSVFTIPCFALYSSTTERVNYIPPLRIQADVDTSTFELTPIVKSFENTLNTETSEIGITTANIKRSNWSITDPSTSTVYKAWRDVSYRLAMTTHHSNDNFVMNLAADVGKYNFTSFDVPMIAVPYGYMVNAEVSYRVWWADGAGNHTEVYFDQSYNGTYYQDDVISLLRPYYISNGNNIDIIGNVLITDYEATLTFTLVGENQGDSGYYTFNEVLSYIPDELYEAMITDGDYWFWCEDNPITIIATLSDGTSQELNIQAIYFDDPSNVNMGYDIPPDYTSLVYDFDSNEWGILYIGEEEITGVELRQLYFSKPFEQTFDPTVKAYDAFSTWFLENTIYSDTSVVLTDTSGNYSFTDGDGGIYISYVAIDSSFSTTNGYLKGLYDNGFDVGYGSGNGEFNGEFVTWLANSVKAFLDVELFPGFSFGGILGMLISIIIVLVFLKFFAGG